MRKYCFISFIFDDFFRLSGKTHSPRQASFFCHAGIENARFKGVVRPGDRLDMEIELLKLKGPIGKSHAVGYVNGKVVVEADMTVAMVDNK